MSTQITAFCINFQVVFKKSSREALHRVHCSNQLDVTERGPFWTDPNVAVMAAAEATDEVGQKFP